MGNINVIFDTVTVVDVSLMAIDKGSCAEVVVQVYIAEL